MSSPYVGEVRMFAGTFAPAGWAMCAGQLMPISQNETLFNLIGTTYGGDGQSTFAVPDLQGRVPVHAGQGPGISQVYQIGETGGVESVTLNTQQIPNHNHALLATTDFGQQAQPQGAFLAQSTTGTMYTDAGNGPPFVNLNANSLAAVGGNHPHENMLPFLVITFIISLFGIFPSQN
jgi:microcystin-dependent protein